MTSVTSPKETLPSRADAEAQHALVACDGPPHPVDSAVEDSWDAVEVTLRGRVGKGRAIIRQGGEPEGTDAEAAQRKTT